MSNKQILGYIRLENKDIDANDIIHLENIGADGVFLADDSMPLDEERLIKLIKAVNEKSDMPLIVKRHYQRLEDVKKILYAGDTRVAMDVVSAADFRLMSEVSDRFGKEKIFAWIPSTQFLTNALASAVVENGAGACVIENQGIEPFNAYSLPLFPVCSHIQPETAASESINDPIAAVVLFSASAAL